MLKTKIKIETHINKHKIYGFNFDWGDIFEKSDAVYSLKDNNKLIGLIGVHFSNNFIKVNNVEISAKCRHHGYGSLLIAFAGWLSFANHDDGCFSLITKTNGTQYFYKKLGARIMYQKCLFFTDTSKHLVKKYKPYRFLDEGESFIYE